MSKDRMATSTFLDVFDRSEMLDNLLEELEEIGDLSDAEASTLPSSKVDVHTKKGKLTKKVDATNTLLEQSAWSVPRTDDRENKGSRGHDFETEETQISFFQSEKNKSDFGWDEDEYDIDSLMSDVLDATNSKIDGSLHGGRLSSTLPDEGKKIRDDVAMNSFFDTDIDADVARSEKELLDATSPIRELRGRSGKVVGEVVEISATTVERESVADVAPIVVENHVVAGDTSNPAAMSVTSSDEDRKDSSRPLRSRGFLRSLWGRMVGPKAAYRDSETDTNDEKGGVSTLRSPSNILRTMLCPVWSSPTRRHATQGKLSRDSSDVVVSPSVSPSSHCWWACSNTPTSLQNRAHIWGPFFDKMADAANKFDSAVAKSAASAVISSLNELTCPSPLREVLANVGGALTLLFSDLGTAVDRIESMLNADDFEAREGTNWKNLTTQMLAKLIEKERLRAAASCNKRTICAIPFRQRVIAATNLWKTYCETADLHDSIHQCHVPCVTPLDRFVRLAAALFASGQNFDETSSSRFRDLEERVFGCAFIGLCASMACFFRIDNKALLLALDRSSALFSKASSRLELVCTRDTVFVDLGHAINDAKKAEVFPLVVNPFFESTYGSKRKRRARDGAIVTVEEGEGFGPRKEMFSLIGKQLVECGGGANECPVRKLFIYHKPTESFWFDSTLSRTPEREKSYVTVGVVLAAALANRCSVCVRFDIALIQALLLGSETVSPSDLKRFDVDIYNACRRAASRSQEDYEDMLEMDDLPTDLPKSEYVATIAKRMLRENVAWQIEAMRRGFFGALGIGDLTTRYHVAACDLQDLLDSPDRDNVRTATNIRAIFRVVEDEELKRSAHLRACFWDIVDNFEESEERKFLEFVTGSDRFPLPQTEILTIEMPFIAFCDEDHEMQLLMHPRAHTCTNTLELPNYWLSIVALRPSHSEEERVLEMRKVMEAKLLFAIANSVGYGLDEV